MRRCIDGIRARKRRIWDSFTGGGFVWIFFFLSFGVLPLMFSPDYGSRVCVAIRIGMMVGIDGFLFFWKDTPRERERERDADRQERGTVLSQQEGVGGWLTVKKK
jgi:hypothetical protein